MSEAGATIKALSEDFDPHIIRTKPGSDRKPATKYVSHGSVTKRLNAVCPGWSSRVIETHTYMDPQKGILKCAGVMLELTIPGVGSRQEFGTASQPRDFGTDAKNAMSDALKRCAMRFGVALDLWESMDEDDEDAQPTPQQATPPREQSRRSDTAPTIFRPAAAPTVAAGPPYKSPYSPGKPPEDKYPDLRWEGFKHWAQPLGYDTRAKCETVIKQDTTAWLPGELRTAMEIRGVEGVAEAQAG